MKKTFIKLLSILLLIICTNVQAQLFRRQWTLGIYAGTSNYLGDLDANFPYKDTKPSFGISIGRIFNPHMAWKIGFMQGWVGANDGGIRNLNFTSPITEFSAMLVYDFFGHKYGFPARPKWSPFIFAGLAVYKFNPQTIVTAAEVDAYNTVFGTSSNPTPLSNSYKGATVDLQPLHTEGQGLAGGAAPYSLFQMSIPMGFGFRFYLGQRWDLKLEFGMRKLFTDYLDDVSDKYYNPQLLRQQSGDTGPLSFILADRSAFTHADGTFNTPITYQNSAYAAGKLRGLKNQNDWYIFTTIGFVYAIDPKERCPKFGPDKGQKY